MKFSIKHEINGRVRIHVFQRGVMSTRVQRATEEMLTIIHRLDTQEELPDGI